MSKRKTRHMLVKKVVNGGSDTIIYFNKETKKGWWLGGEGSLLGDAFCRGDYNEVSMGEGTPLTLSHSELRDMPGTWVV